MVKIGKNKQFNVINKLIIFLFIVIIFMAVGYSVYEGRLCVDNSEIAIRIDKNVRINSFQYYETNSNGEILSTNYNINQVYTDIKLPNNDSSVTYKISVKNYGNVEVGISDIRLNEKYQSILQVETNSYEIGDKIRDNEETCDNSVDACKLNIEKEFYITIKYVDGAYDENNTTFENIVLNLDFKEAFRVQLNGFDELETVKKDYVALNESTYEIFIGTLLENEELIVTMNGIETLDYTYNNGYLTVPNVSGEIAITKTEKNGTYYNIEYINIAVQNYPTVVKEGGNITITFTEPIPTEITVLNSDNYVYENGILTIQNITSNISIIATDNVDVPLNPPEGTNNAIVTIPSITPDNPINVKDLLTESFDGQNYNDRIINQIDVTITYNSSTGARQSFNVDLVIGTQTYTQTVTVNGKQTNYSTTISYNNIAINKYDTFKINNVQDTTGNGIKNGNIDIVNYEIKAYFAE